MTWYIKRRPQGKSYFRDGFPYLQIFTYLGSFWVETRKDAKAFEDLKLARKVLKEARKTEPEAYIVRTK